MMRSMVLLVSLLFMLYATPALAAGVTVSDLVEQAKAYDGKQVTLQGEVIGDVMRRGEYGWINIT
ncbi:MAG TPA: hypothetical protein VD902_00650, partial [Symbiobacteriaceae bacterium]|nr:hypothetical protein [Symbiobacteriaceae bacterium]